MTFPMPTARTCSRPLARGLEGIIAKQKDAPYVSTRTKSWLKIKCTARQEFVVVGFVDRAGSNKSEAGRLLLGYYENSALRYGRQLRHGLRHANRRGHARARLQNRRRQACTRSR